MKITIEKTADGSPTLYREDIDEHYHSVKGALAESRHVYLEKGWSKAAETSRPVRVFEVGFGTGMNAAITAAASLVSGIPTDYFSVELYPLPKETTDLVAETLWEEYRDAFERVNESSWEEPIRINPYFSLQKMKADLLTMDIPKELDVVYFDAFAPEKQPEMWDAAIFRRIYSAMKPRGVLTTYCAKGSIRRMLQQIGFLTERLPGPPGGKREILRATKPTDAMNC
ncbi:MAG: tRNA (5-methylaminomethyl-2-thiouridine)(34)-methyltransferase MnmD [Muribaculaceae bacterium]|nr:tRNA (5-methylaminomethyl-2-thiouridine)(34)-methyltransferase MnmD [Muribaculaceae bacterium]